MQANKKTGSADLVCRAAHSLFHSLLLAQKRAKHHSPSASSALSEGENSAQSCSHQKRRKIVADGKPQVETDQNAGEEDFSRTAGRQISVQVCC